jgi:hypothetical protein
MQWYLHLHISKWLGWQPTSKKHKHATKIKRKQSKKPEARKRTREKKENKYQKKFVVFIIFMFPIDCLPQPGLLGIFGSPTTLLLFEIRPGRPVVNSPQAAS